MPMLVEATWGYLSYESGVWQALPEPHLRVHSHGYFNTAFSWGSLWLMHCVWKCCSVAPLLSARKFASERESDSEATI